MVCLESKENQDYGESRDQRVSLVREEQGAHWGYRDDQGTQQRKEIPGTLVCLERRERKESLENQDLREARNSVQTTIS